MEGALSNTPHGQNPPGTKKNEKPPTPTQTLQPQPRDPPTIHSGQAAAIMTTNQTKAIKAPITMQAISRTPVAHSPPGSKRAMPIDNRILGCRSLNFWMVKW